MTPKRDDRWITNVLRKRGGFGGTTQSCEGISTVKPMGDKRKVLTCSSSLCRLELPDWPQLL